MQKLYQSKLIKKQISKDEAERILKAENEKWNIYKNYDYWKYPTIAITRNTSLEGHRVRTEITCSGTYLSAKLIYSYPSDWKNTDIRKKLILENSNYRREKF